MWHVSSRSGLATLQTAVHLLLTYLLSTDYDRVELTELCISFTRRRQNGSLMYSDSSVVENMAVFHLAATSRYIIN